MKRKLYPSLLVQLLILCSFITSLASAQELVTVTGSVVSSDDNQPLAGVTIILKNTTRGTNTNSEGNFSLQMTAQQRTDGVLVVSSTGYHRQEVKIQGRSTLKFSISKDVMVLNDVVVTNSYTRPKRKEEVVGSIATVTAEQLQANRPIESLDKMLEGLAAGVQVETSTELGTPVKVNIRGQNSLTNLTGSNRTQLTTSSQPLYVVDGVPIIEQRRGDEPIAFLNNEQLLNPLAGINPDDIESISVLKDAAAAAIYGANASNGVIIITTKKGKAGKTRLGFGYSGGWSQSINRIKWLNGQQYHDLVKEMYLNDGRSPFDAELLAGSREINTPWFELVNRYGTFQNYDLELSGGSDNTQFRFSTSYLGQQAIQKGNDFQKVYLRLRLDHQLAKKLSLTVSMNPTLTKKNAINVYSAVPIIPNVPAYNADGSFYKFSNLGVPNPLAILDQNTNVHNGGTFNGNVRLEYIFSPKLRVSTNFGIDALQNKQTQFDSRKNATGESKGGFAQIYDRTNFSWISSSQASYNTDFGKKQHVEVTAGFEAQSQSSKLLRGEGSGFSYDRLTELSNASSQSSASSRQEGTSFSIYGQALYDFSKKYFATVSGRYDAASIFGTDVNATVNGALGLGWIISKEKFMEKVEWIDMLRIRGSYGSTGNSRIGSYEARGLYTFSNTGYNGQTAASPSSAPNFDLTWEKNYKTNVGIDIGILKRVNITLDAYQNIVDDAISPINIPAANGFTTTLANVGKMRNRGFDAQISGQILQGKVSWFSTLNFGFNRNKVLEVKNNTEQYSSSEAASLLKAGVSTSAIWGFTFAGIDPATGREQYFDNTGKVVSVLTMDRNIRSAYYLGDRLPKVQGGFINSISYEGVTLSFNLLYSIGAKAVISYQNENNGRNLQNRNQSVNLLDRWQKPGDITNIPVLSTLSNPIVANSSRYVYDDTYIKLSNVSIAYALPKKITSKLKGVTATVFINGTNLAYWYKQKSPEGRNGIREYKFDFPEAQSYTWGVRLGL